MVNDDAMTNTAMEGGGFYNRNSSLQEAGIRLALPLLAAAADAVPIDGLADSPLVIADYGSSQGRNSMCPMALAIDRLRTRAGAETPVEVIHTDLPSNDFTSLFTVLADESVSYLTGRPGVFPSAVGRSYFETILPPGRVHLGWSSWALHWLSSLPVDAPDHCFPIFSASARVREAMREQSANDWAAFLGARSSELAPGAKLVSLSMGASPPEGNGWEWVWRELWRAALDMADEGLLTAVELTRFTAPVVWRTKADLEAPFSGGDFHGLSLEYAAVLEAPDPFWEEYKATGDAAQWGRRWKGMSRAVWGPTASAAFAARPESDTLVDDLFDRLEARISASLQPLHPFAAIAVICKASRAGRS